MCVCVDLELAGRYRAVHCLLTLLSGCVCVCVCVCVGADRKI